MIVLDTNVISALMRSQPDPVVVAWVNDQPEPSLWTTSLTVYEIEYGLALLPRGRKRGRLTQAWELALREDLGARILDLDAPAARDAAAFSAAQRAAGQVADVRDALIAGIVTARKATLATGNTRHFEHAGVRVVDPWRPA